MLEAVQARLEARVPEFAGRVKLAADFQAVMSGRLPLSGGVNVWVIPAGLQGLAATAASGDFAQEVRRTISVVTMLQSTDGTGRRALDRVDDLLLDIARALCGWAPGNEVGVFELAQERPATPSAGQLAYVTDFRINDHLRVTP